MTISKPPAETTAATPPAETIAATPPHSTTAARALDARARPSLPPSLEGVRRLVRRRRPAPHVPGTSRAARRAREPAGRARGRSLARERGITSSHIRTRKIASSHDERKSRAGAARGPRRRRRARRGVPRRDARPLEAHHSADALPGTVYFSLVQPRGAWHACTRNARFCVINLFARHVSSAPSVRTNQTEHSNAKLNDSYDLLNPPYVFGVAPGGGLAGPGTRARLIRMFLLATRARRLFFLSGPAARRARQEDGHAGQRRRRRGPDARPRLL